MDLISRAWCNLAPPGAISPPDDLTRPPVSDEPPPFIHDISEDDLLGSIASFWPRSLQFRSTPINRHHQVPSAYRKRAKGRPRKAAKFDADWRFSGHHTHPYVSGSDMKNAVV
jgi:hypothetical protein